MEQKESVFNDVATIAVTPPIQCPPDKGGWGVNLPDNSEQGRYIRYNPTLTEKERQNRRNPTPAENKLWFEVLRDRQLAGAKFTRQKPLGEYIVDFYCAELTLAIEIDGDSHAEQAEYDRRRTAHLNRLGIDLVRYSNRDILTNLDGVHSDLAKRIQNRREKPPKSPLSGGLS